MDPLNSFFALMRVLRTVRCANVDSDVIVLTAMWCAGVDSDVIVLTAMRCGQ